MKKTLKLIVIIFFCFKTKINSQNLILNPSFESITVATPFSQGSGLCECAFGIINTPISVVTNWYAAQGTPQLMDNNNKICPETNSASTHSGARVAYFVDITEGIFQNVNTQNGKAYKLSFWAKGGGNLQAKLSNGLQPYSGGINSYTLPNPSSSLAIFNPLTNTNYQLFTTNFFPNINYSQL